VGGNQSSFSLSAPDGGRRFFLLCLRLTAGGDSFSLCLRLTAGGDSFSLCLRLTAGAIPFRSLSTEWYARFRFAPSSHGK